MRERKAETVTLAFALILFFLMLNSPAFAVPTTEYTASTATTCDGGICTKSLYSGTMFQQDEFSVFHPMTTVTKILYDNGKLKVKWNDSDSLDNEIDLETLISFGGEFFKPIDAECSDMDYTIDIHDIDYNYKYDIAFNLPANDTQILLDINTDFNYSLFDTYLNIDAFRFGFEDAIAENYTVNISTYMKADKEIIRINLTKDWDFYNISVNDSVVIDPTIQLKENDTEILEDTFIDEEYPDNNNGSSEHLEYYYTGSAESYPFIKYNISTIPDGVHIDDVVLYTKTQPTTYSATYSATKLKNNLSWSEDTLTWNTAPCTGNRSNDTCYHTELSSYTTVASKDIFWTDFPMEFFLRESYHNDEDNITFLKWGDIVANQHFLSKESAFGIDFLNITYTIETDQKTFDPVIDKGGYVTNTTSNSDDDDFVSGDFGGESVGYIIFEGWDAISSDVTVSGAFLNISLQGNTSSGITHCFGIYDKDEAETFWADDTQTWGEYNQTNAKHPFFCETLESATIGQYYTFAVNQTGLNYLQQILITDQLTNFTIVHYSPSDTSGFLTYYSGQDGDANSPTNPPQFVVQFTDINTAPTLDTKELYPASPYTTDDLTLNATCSDIDTGNTLTAVWTIYKDDANQTALHGSTVVSNGTETLIYTIASGNTTKDEVWIAEIYCDDTNLSSSSANTTSRTILNSLPVIGTPTLNDSTPETDDAILCINGTVTDADGDTITWYYRWYDTGAEIAGQVLSTLGLSTAGLDKGDTIICSTIASDGTVNATAWKNTTEATIQNTAPTTTTPTLSETNIYKNISSLTCNNASMTDVDDDTVTWHYQWHLDNITNVTTQAITNSTYSEGEQLICEIWADDGTANSTHYNSTTLTVLNSQPAVSGVTISPTPAESSDDLNSSYTYYDVDSDAEVTQYYEWYLDGVMVSTSQNLSSGNLSGAENVTLSIIVNDGTDNSTAVNSSTLTIGDSTAPVLHTQSMSGISGFTNIAFTVGINVTEANNMAWVYAEVTNPAAVSTNLSMSLDSGSAPERYYTKSYTPTVVGLHTFKFYGLDGSGNLGYYAGTQEYTAIVDTSSAGGGGSSSFTIIQEGVCGDGVCTGDETSESCPIDCLPDFYMTPENTDITVGFDGKKTGRIKIINNGVKDKTITVTVSPADYIYIDGDGNEEYVKTYKIGRKVGLQSGEAYVEWEIDLSGSNRSLGEYDYILTFDDGFNVVSYGFTMTVTEAGVSPEILIGTVLGGLLLVTVAPPFIRRYKLKRKRR